MTRYLDRIDAAAPLVRGLPDAEPLPFFAELRAERPVFALPTLTIVSRYADCVPESYPLR